MSNKTLMTLSIIGTALCAVDEPKTALASQLSFHNVISRAVTKTAVTSENLNLRAKATTNGTILITIPKGKTVTLLSENSNGWYQAQYAGKTGYVSATFLKDVKSTIETTAKTTANLNLRSKANSNSSKLLTIPKGTTISLLSSKDANGWYKAEYNGKTGFVNGSYLTNIKSNSSTSNESTNSNNSTESTTTKKGTTTDRLNLRSKASTSGTLLTTIPKGKTVTVLAGPNNNGWYKVQYGSHTGYVSGAYLKVTTSTSSNNTSNNTSSNNSTTTEQTPLEGQTLDNLNLRSKASATGTKILTIPKGSTIRLLSDKDANGWYQVSYDGRTGYVSGDYVKVTKYQQPELAVLWSGTVNANDVRIFEKNSTKSTVLGYHQSGQVVEVVGASGRGYKIKYKDDYAWIQQAYVTKGSLPKVNVLWTGEITEKTKLYSNTSTTSTSLKTLNKETSVEVIEESTNWLKIKNGNGFGYVQRHLVKAPTASEEPSTVLWTGKTTTNLNVRQTPAANGMLLGTLAEGTSVDVYKEESNGWLQIKFKDGFAYVSGSYVKKDSEETPETSNRVAYVHNLDGIQLNVRPQPTTSQAAIGKLSEGDTIIVTGETGNWYEILYNNKTAFVSKDYVTFTKPGAHPDGNINFEESPRKGIVIDGVPTLNVRQSATTSSSKLGTLTSKNEVLIVGSENNFYKIEYNDGYAYVSKDYVGVVATQTNINGRVSYLTTKYNYTLSDFAKTQQKYTSGVLSSLTNYVNPSHSMHTDYLLQFLRVDQFRSFNVSGLNKQLQYKGVLHNQAQAFYDAAKYYNIDPIFFVSQSIHETNWGSSSLAKGITITEIADTNKPIRNSSGVIVDYQRIPLSKPVTVYNLFGIGAQDHAPRLLGTTYAYKQGWTTIEKAIYGAAEFVSSNYINSSKYEQNTPFKIKFNHISSNQWHQYATTPWYAYEIGKYMHRFANLYDANQEFLLDIPVYK